MTTPDSFNTAADLRNALGLQNYIALFDDNNVRDPAILDNSPQVQQCLELGAAEVRSWLTNFPNGTVPARQGGAGGDTAVSKLLKAAELLYCKVHAYGRRPAYVKTYGAEPGGALIQRAEAMMRRIQDSVQQVPPDDHPPGGVRPTNVGGFEQAGTPRMVLDEVDGTNNRGDWG